MSIKKEITLKDYISLSIHEHKELLQIRNEEYIRSVSLNTDVIEIENHLKFVESLKNANKKFYAVFFEEKIIGGVNVFDLDDEVKWGIFFKDDANLIVKSIVPIFFIEYLFENFVKDELFLEVKSDNVNTISYDKNLGFKTFKEDNGIITMKMNKKEFEEAKNGSFLKRVEKQLDKFDFKII